jgi:hypothetical protein
MPDKITGYVGNTDYDWYQFLSAHPEFRDVSLQRLREFYSPKLICDSGVRAILYA